MGQQVSFQPIDPSIPPSRLQDRTLRSLAQYILSPRCRSIIFLVGAGISTSAGIPDFRSPDTGLYSSLRHTHPSLPEPEAIFELDYFLENPYPFYTLAQHLWPGAGKYKPTPAHLLMRLVQDKRRLQRVFTQNIDTLELAAGIEPSSITFAHGSFASQRCAAPECKSPYPRDKMEEHVARGDPPVCEVCGSWVKPEIVFFGEQLPSEFFESRRQMEHADLVIVMGSSLKVFPFAAMPMLAPESSPRLLINKERVGEIGSRRDDVICRGEIDEVVERLVELLGWQEEFTALRQELGQPISDSQAGEREVEREVESLVKDVEEGLKMAGQHREWVERGLESEERRPTEEIGTDKGPRDSTAS